MDHISLREIQKKLKLTDQATAEVLGLPLFNVQMWRCGVWPVPSAAANYLQAIRNRRCNGDKGNVQIY